MKRLLVKAMLLAFALAFPVPTTAGVDVGFSVSLPPLIHREVAPKQSQPRHREVQPRQSQPQHRETAPRQSSPHQGKPGKGEEEKQDRW